MEISRIETNRKRSRWDNTKGDNKNELYKSNTQPNSSICKDIENKKVEDRIRKRKQTHPKHLIGKEIGLYYALASNKEKRSRMIASRARKMMEIGKLLAKVIIPTKKKSDLQALLKNIKGFDTSYLSKGISSVKNSEFKTEFIKIISGTFYTKLRDKSLKKVLFSNIMSNHNYHSLHMQLNANAAVKNMLAARRKLPCYRKKEETLELIKNNQIVVISGETGCGKTTQIPQYILDDYIVNKKGSECKILCTQPRRISAISVAERVATERGEKCGGSSVGFHIRLEKKLPRETASITYCTTGILLKLMETNPSLSSYSHLILDEIHERDVISDFVLTLMKMVVVERPDMKLILMSATLNAEQFSKYYNNCPIINIPGFTFPVQVNYLEDALAKTKYNFPPYQELKGWKRHLKHNKLKRQAAEELADLMGPYVRNLQAKKKYTNQVYNNLLNPNSENIETKLIVELIKYICSISTDDASILVFLPGFIDIARLTTSIADSKCFPPYKYLVISLHSKLPSIEQRKVFEKPRKGIRKIVVATNIAETSITIDDIVYVIDSGKVKMKSYDVDEDIEILKNEWVTVANANQRKGRAGRVQAGVCYHLFSRPRFFHLESYPTPEVQRTRLESIILTVKLLQLGKAKEFLNSLMNPPHAKAVDNAVSLLKQMNALDKKEQLTPLGYHLAKLPVHPRVGKMILLGALFSCLDPVLSIAASLDFKDAFQYPVDKQTAVNERKLKLLSGWNSDHLVLAEAIKQYEIEKAKGKDRDFCFEFFLSRPTLELLCKMKEQFAEYLYDMKFISNKGVKSREWNQNSKNLSLVKAIVCAGLYPNVAIISKVNKRGVKIVRTTQCEKVVISTNSVNSLETKFSSPLLVYHLKQKLMQINLFDTSMVHPLPLLFFGDKLIVEPLKNNRGASIPGKNNYVVSISQKLRFRCTKENARIIRELREKLDDLLLFKVTHPGWVSWLDEKLNPEVKLMKGIMELITSEDLGDFDIETDDELKDSVY